MLATSVISSEFFILLLIACTQLTIRKFPTIRIALRTLHIQPRRTANTVGKSFLVSGCISHISGTLEFRSVSLDITIFSDLRGLGSEERKKLLRPFAEKWPQPAMADLSRCGETVYKRARFCTSIECLEDTTRLMRSGFAGPVNIGSEEIVTINELARVAMDIAGKKLEIEHKLGPTGVRGRNSDNRLIKERLAWAPSQPLRTGLEHTYAWIERQILRNAA